MPGSRIERDPTAGLALGGRLALGFFPSRVGDTNVFASRREAHLRLRESSLMKTGGDVWLGAGVRCVLAPAARLSIGADTFITADSLVLCGESVTIGSGCAISWQVQIMDWDFHQIDETVASKAPVTIGDHVWIGARATVLKGVTIGDGAVVGAGSIVTRDVPPRAVIAGNPARVLREQVDWKL
jgi:acetyltransferase-like isoleucine patch superfamily enzyme